MRPSALFHFPKPYQRHRLISDNFLQRAKIEGFPSRAAFKLQDLDKRFGLIGKGDVVVDCGCGKGGWCEVGRRKGAWVVGVDAEDSMRAGGSARGNGKESVSGGTKNPVRFIQSDIQDTSNILRAFHQLHPPAPQAHLLLSDLSPPLSGIPVRDAILHQSLFNAILRLLPPLLKRHGKLVFKAFAGFGDEEMRKVLKERFRKVKSVKAVGGKKGSREVYLVGVGYVGEGNGEGEVDVEERKKDDD